MDPNISPGKYTISITTETGTYYIGRMRDNPDTIDILPEVVDPLPIFTVENAGGIDEYTISIDGRLVNEKGDGKLCLGNSEANEKWKFVSLGDMRYIVNGKSGCLSRKSFDPTNVVHSIGVPDMRTCADCPQNCECSNRKECKHGTSCPCRGSAFATQRATFNTCSGCPSPCLLMLFVPAPV